MRTSAEVRRKDEVAEARPLEADIERRRATRHRHPTEDLPLVATQAMSTKLVTSTPSSASPRRTSWCPSLDRRGGAVKSTVRKTEWRAPARQDVVRPLKLWQGRLICRDLYRPRPWLCRASVCSRSTYAARLRVRRPPRALTARGAEPAVPAVSCGPAGNLERRPWRPADVRLGGSYGCAVMNVTTSRRPSGCTIALMSSFVLRFRVRHDCGSVDDVN